MFFNCPKIKISEPQFNHGRSEKSRKTKRGFSIFFSGCKQPNFSTRIKNPISDAKLANNYDSSNKFLIFNESEFSIFSSNHRSLILKISSFGQHKQKQ